MNRDIFLPLIPNYLVGYFPNCEGLLPLKARHYLFINNYINIYVYDNYVMNHHI